MEEPSFIVPTEMVDEAEAVVKLLKEAVKSQGRDDRVYLLQPKSMGFGPEELRTMVLVFNGTMVTWLTKKWIDAYLWPLVQERIDAPSRRFIDWLKQHMP